MLLVRNFGLSFFVILVDGNNQRDERNDQQGIFDKVRSFRCGYNGN